MISRVVSIVIFYRDDASILVQDRRNMRKDMIGWGFFWGGAEGAETPEATAIREIQEELCLSLTLSDLTKIGSTVTTYEHLRQYDVTVFISPWKAEYEARYSVREWAGAQWMTVADMKTKYIYPIDRVHLDIFEKFFSSHYSWKKSPSISSS